MTAVSAEHTRRSAASARVTGRDWRAIAFRCVASLISLLLGALVVPLLLVPWRGADVATADYIPELHRWHDAYIAALLCILVIGSLLAAIPRPRQVPLLVQCALTGLAILIGFTIHPLNGPALMIAMVTFALVFVAYPDVRSLLVFPRNGRPSVPHLALAMAATVPLARDAWTNIGLQHTDVSEHAVHHHWYGVAAVAVTLIVAGYLIAGRRAGWRALGIIVGLAYLYLGAAALALPTHDGSWGANGGYLSLAGGAAFIVVTLAVALRERATRPYAA